MVVQIRQNIFLLPNWSWEGSWFLSGEPDSLVGHKPNPPKFCLRTSFRETLMIKALIPHSRLIAYYFPLLVEPVPAAAVWTAEIT